MAIGKLSYFLRLRLTPAHDQLHRMFVNAPGSGKTRLSLEALCLRWGFYFNCGQDPELQDLLNDSVSSCLGSQDLWTAYDFLGRTSNFRPVTSLEPKDAKGNSKLAELVFSKVLLARLLVFSAFLHHIPLDEITDPIYKIRWTYLQVQPSIIPTERDDIFTSILHFLDEREDQDYIDAKIKATFATISRLYGKGRIYIVIDEAQLGIERLPEAFHSSNKLKPQHRPFLRQLVYTWRRKLATKHLEASFLISATRLSSEKFLEVVASVTSKPQFSASVYTGSFDNDGDQIAYIMPFIPDHLRLTADFQVLFTRIRQWLRGRFVSSFLLFMLWN